MPLKLSAGVKVTRLPAPRLIVPSAVVIEPPTLTSVPPTLSWVTCGVAPSKLSSVAPLVPVIGLKVMAVSSLVVMTSLLISATWLMLRLITSTAGAVAVPSLVVTVSVALPL